MIKAAFFDIDGTLLSFKNHSMPDSARAVLLKLREIGVKTFLSTGRNGDSTRFLMETGLFDGEILINGQLCEMDGECIFQNPVDQADIEAVIACAESGEFTLGFLGGHESFVSAENQYVVDACAYAGMAIPRTEPAALARAHAIFQIHCYGAPGTEDRLLSHTKKLTAVRWSPNFADVFPTGGGKDKGTEAVCKKLGIDVADTIAFGDGENDISMIEYAGIGVAMGNASDKVKASADFVTRSVDEDGIAFAFDHFRDKFGL